MVTKQLILARYYCSKENLPTDKLAESTDSYILSHSQLIVWSNLFTMHSRAKFVLSCGIGEYSREKGGGGGVVFISTCILATSNVDVLLKPHIKLY